MSVRARGEYVVAAAIAGRAAGVNAALAARRKLSEKMFSMSCGGSISSSGVSSAIVTKL